VGNNFNFFTKSEKDDKHKEYVENLRLLMEAAKERTEEEYSEVVERLGLGPDGEAFAAMNMFGLPPAAVMALFLVGYYARDNESR